MSIFQMVQKKQSVCETLFLTTHTTSGEAVHLMSSLLRKEPCSFCMCQLASVISVSMVGRRTHAGST